MSWILRSHRFRCHLSGMPWPSSSNSLRSIYAQRSLPTCVYSFSALCMSRCYEHSNASSHLGLNAHSCAPLHFKSNLLKSDGGTACPQECSSTNNETATMSRASREQVSPLHHLHTSDALPPPHPANYVPPEKRDADDKSLFFWPQESTKSHVTPKVQHALGKEDMPVRTCWSHDNHAPKRRGESARECAPTGDDKCTMGEESLNGVGLGSAGSLYAGQPFASMKPVVDGGWSMLDGLDATDEYGHNKYRHPCERAGVGSVVSKPTLGSKPSSTIHAASQPGTPAQPSHEQSTAAAVTSDGHDTSEYNGEGSDGPGEVRVSWTPVQPTHAPQPWTSRTWHRRITQRTGRIAGRAHGGVASCATFYDAPDRRMDGSGMGDNGTDPRSGDVVRAQSRWTREMERDIAKLEYYHGTAQYADMHKRFRAKYGGRLAQGKQTSTHNEYSQEEQGQGLVNEPIDYHRSSRDLKLMLQSGPFGYSPFSVLQQHGMTTYRGTTFSAATRLGRLRGVDAVKTDMNDMGQGSTLTSSPSSSSSMSTMSPLSRPKQHGLVPFLRRRMNAWLGRTDPADRFLSAQSSLKQDTHLMYRVFGIDAMQRRQLRFMLTDFDCADRHIAFHVMMSYPHTDWLHAFYMILVGCLLYQCQIGCHAYELYDEYLGLDLRQVPSMKKPVIACVTFFFMVYFMFQPLLVASIASTRAYRIVMRRPIGPP